MYKVRLEMMADRQVHQLESKLGAANVADRMLLNLDGELDYGMLRNRMMTFSAGLPAGCGMLDAALGVMPPEMLQTAHPDTSTTVVGYFLPDDFSLATYDDLASAERGRGDFAPVPGIGLDMLDTSTEARSSYVASEKSSGKKYPTTVVLVSG
ncbi:hypothetical protein PLESTB_001413300 [Pleodorina starrii]|uniref:Uncharacterized protein n=1 Tax=Pleodorina starrii TaxID=330485 RepID=A0A9W6BVB7_9CHLO|nr:hypothetical protein PLESTM_001374700 [Pleodorina starrii]GLC58884.1 hypothetical protein PLESTB_001413300 [Pleodorina starrii]GLC65041.1 hypothetical protein PLESTF_000240100 [Pleodorina starrii]